MNERSRRDKRVLQLVSRHATIREMAAELDVALGTIHYILARLERGGLVVRPPIRLARMRRLTQKGKHVLHRKAILK